MTVRPIHRQVDAPTGSWLPGEFLSTRHHISVPVSDELSDETIFRVGLYQPQGNIRLPVTRNGETNGDAVELALPRKPE